MAVRVDCADTTSGVASCPQDHSALDTVGTGPQTLTATATDAAGNPAGKEVGHTLVAAPAATSG